VTQGLKLSWSGTGQPLHETSLLYLVGKSITSGTATNIRWHRGPKAVACRFCIFYWPSILHCISLKYFLQYQKILFLTEVILIWLEQSKKWKNWIKGLRFFVFRVIIIDRNHYFIILNYSGYKGLYSVSNKTNGI